MPAGIVGITICSVPAVRAATAAFVTMRKLPRVTLAVVPWNPNPVNVTTVPDGPLVGVANKAVIAIWKPAVAFSPRASVTLKLYSVVGRLGTFTVVVKFPEVSAKVIVATVKVPAGVAPKSTLTCVPEICANPVPVMVTGAPGGAEVGETEITVPAVSLNPPVPEVAPVIGVAAESVAETCFLVVLTAKPVVFEGTKN